jgi:two-component system, OmpR family, sensor histidine kinase BaeS
MTDYRRRRFLGIGELGMRIILAFLVVAFASVLVDVIITATVTDMDFDQFVLGQEHDAAQTAAVAAGLAYADHGGWQDAPLKPVLSGLEHTEIRVTDSTGGLVARSPGFGTDNVSPSAQAPVIVAGHHVGTVTLRFNHSGLDAAITRLEAQRWWVRIYAAGIAVVIALFVSALVSRRVTAPIDRTLAAMRSRAAGHRETRIADLRAIGELGELLAAYNEVSDSVDRQERAQRNLVADVAHELRTPAAVLQAGHEAMLDGITEPTTENLSSLHDEVLRLGRSLEALRALAAAEAAALQLRLVPHDFAAVAADAAATLAAPVDMAGLQLSSKLSKTMVLCDYERMREVITNLLTNAIKYTPAGGVIQLEVGPEAGHRAILRVTDGGVGIPPDELPHVTERFFRGRTSQDMAAGTGLGLTIAAELMRAHHGELGITSEPGRGTQVTITLPQVPAKPPGADDGPPRRHHLPEHLHMPGRFSHRG